VGRELAVRRAQQSGPDAFATRMPKHWIGAAVKLTIWLQASVRHRSPRACSEQVGQSSTSRRHYATVVALDNVVVVKE
jgi:hypothetical protein